MEKQITYEIYDNMLGVAELNSLSANERTKTAPYRFPVQGNIIGTAWVLDGECTLQMEETPYSLSRHDFLLMPSWEAVHITSVSPGFKAKIILADKSFMDECISNKQILSFLNCLLIKKNLKTKLDDEEICLLTANFDILQEKISIHTHSYYREVVPVNFMSFILDVTHILKNKTGSRLSSGRSSRKEEMFHKFLNLLLDNYREQHEVAFYAQKLFITPQYLTHIIKDVTGKTTNKWIDDTLILEARKLLKTTQTTVQQIADLLNFSDQSAFGKFFKKYHGISPAEYRKLYYNSLSIA